MVLSLDMGDCCGYDQDHCWGVRVLGVFRVRACV